MARKKKSLANMSKVLPKKNPTFSKSIKVAWTGFRYSIKERNIQIQVAVAVIVIVLTIIFPLEALERIIVFILIGLVIALEILNTAFEKFIDFHVKTLEPDIARVKDIAAAAVFLVSFIALGIGLWIFGKYFW